MKNSPRSSRPTRQQPTKRATRLRSLISLACALQLAAGCGSPRDTGASDLADATNPALERRARSEFAALPNKADKEYLDDFIDNYRGTAAADVAFTFRFQATQTSFNIAEYNEFIEKYGETLAGRLAVYEVYELYARRNALPSFMDFIERYPNSAEALVAKANIHVLLFEFAKKISDIGELSIEERVAALDDFVFVNSMAPQVPAAMLMSKLLMVEAETREIEQIKAKVREEFPSASEADLFSIQSQKLSERANSLATKFEVTLAVIEAMQRSLGLSYESPTDDPKLLTQRIAAERIAFVLQTVHPERDATRRVREQQRFEGLLRSISELKTTIKEENAKLISALREEFAATREVLRVGFSELREQLIAVNNRLDTIHLDLELTNAKLEQMNRHLETAVASLARIDQKLARSNQLIEEQITVSKQAIEVMHTDLQFLHDAVKNMNQDMNRNAVAQNQLLDQIGGTLQDGFTMLHQDNEVMIAENRETRQQLVDELRSVNQTVATGFSETRDRLDAQLAQATQFHIEEMRQNEDLHSQLRETVQTSNAELVQTMNANANAIRHDLGVMGQGIRQDLRELNTTVQVTGQRTVQAINRSTDRIIDTHKRQTDRVIYKLGRVETAVNNGTNVIRKELKEVNSNLTSIAAEQRTITGTLANMAIDLKAGAGRSTATDQVGIMADVLRSDGASQAVAQQLCGSMQPSERIACVQVTQAVAKGGVDLASMTTYCDGMRDPTERDTCRVAMKGFTEGRVTRGDMGRLGGRYLCGYFKVDSSLDCGALGEMAAEGNFSVGGVAKAASEYACKQVRPEGIDCRDVGIVASCAADIYTGNWVGAGQTLVANAPRVAEVSQGAVDRLGSAGSDILSGEMPTFSW